jgi:hypothetical protein
MTIARLRRDAINNCRLLCRRTKRIGLCAGVHGGCGRAGCCVSEPRSSRCGYRAAEWKLDIAVGGRINRFRPLKGYVVVIANNIDQLADMPIR